MESPRSAEVLLHLWEFSLFSPCHRRPSERWLVQSREQPERRCEARWLARSCPEVYLSSSCSPVGRWSEYSVRRQSKTFLRRNLCKSVKWPLSAPTRGES